MRRQTGLILSLLAAVGLTVGAFATSAGAQSPPTFTVTKVVDGEATPPPDAQFVVTVVCTSTGTEETTEITFDAEGAPVGTNTVAPPSTTGSCTFTETETASASSVAYACSVEDPQVSECSGGDADPVTITFDAAADVTGEVTVTNTFDPPPPPPPLEIQPVFTG